MTPTQPKSGRVLNPSDSHVVDWPCRVLVFVALSLLLFIELAPPNFRPKAIPGGEWIRTPARLRTDGPKPDNAAIGCVVNVSFIGLEEIDLPPPNATIPDHVLDFNKKNIPLLKYPSSELLLVSTTSNATYEREIAQRYTFGRIFEIRFSRWNEYPHCVLCNDEDQSDQCHCPSFHKQCHTQIWFHRTKGWWCNNKRDIFALMTALEERKGKELPRWVHHIDDNTFVNPISLTMLIENLNPDKEYYIGDTMFNGNMVAGGAGQLFSRGALKKLMGKPMAPTVTYRWTNGTETIEVETQLESCLARTQGGDWCYFHGDWAIAECLREVGVTPIDLGGSRHSSFFTQMYEPDGKSGSQWFNMKEKEVADIMHHTHTVAFHSKTTEEMYDAFYNHVVPFYLRMGQGYQ